MNPTPSPIEHLSNQRLCSKEIERQAGSITNLPLLQQLLDAIPSIVILLNLQRQVVFANKSFWKFIGVENRSYVKGLRFGEYIGCASYSRDSEMECGTMEYCRFCAASLSTLSSRQDYTDTRDSCFMFEREDRLESREFRISAAPITFSGEVFTVLTLEDISNEKRRRILERIFFHDVLNTAANLKGFIEIMKDADPKRTKHISEAISLLSEQLLSEVRSQMELLAAENNELALHPLEINSLQVIEEVACQYVDHDLGREKYLCIERSSENVSFVSDMTLLQRVIGNMVKNALEASTKGHTVTLGCKTWRSTIQFWVHNASVIPRDVQPNIFQRSFSTKGSGRGIGTYSMKLLSERYLKGTVYFNSSEQTGTVFTAQYPLIPPQELEIT